MVTGADVKQLNTTLNIAIIVLTYQNLNEPYDATNALMMYS